MNNDKRKELLPFDITNQSFHSRDEMEVAVKQHAKSSCKKCYGRGFVGFRPNTNTIILCRCVKTTKKVIK